MNRGAVALAAETKRSSQVDVAKATGVSQSWLSRLVRGEGKPNREQAVELKRVLGIEVEWWDQEAEEDPPATERASWIITAPFKCAPFRSTSRGAGVQDERSRMRHHVPRHHVLHRDGVDGREEVLREPSRRQLDVLRAIRDFTRKRGYAPGLRDLCELFEWRSTTAALDHLHALERKGLILRDIATARSTRLTADGERAIGW
jgi:transcriptional regulator with XRE-family HTH domain